MSAPPPSNSDRVPVVAIEPDLAEHVLDLLEVADLTPELTAAAKPELVAVTVPANQLERARATIDLVLPGLLAEEAGELLPDEAPGSGLSGRLIRRTDWPEEPSSKPPPPRQLLDGRAAFADQVLGPQASTPDQQGDEDDFVPPVPPPIPRGTVATRFAWLGAVGGPILMLLTALLGLGTFVAGIGLIGFIVGFGALVAMTPDRPRTDDGWDDGAVL